MTQFSGKVRNSIIDSIELKSFDLIIIGGGITGAGIFLDAQSRGLSCCLLEMKDFAEGTSSKSTRLIHGGLRYLKQWNFKLVRDTGRERTIVQNIARHLTYPKKIVVPSIKNGNFSKIQLGLALGIYELLANVPKVFRHRSLSLKRTSKEIPLINPKNLLGAIEYVEFQTNDSRLTIENIKTTVKRGGVAINRFKVNRLSFDGNEMANGVYGIDLVQNKECLIQSRSVVNATGPWSDQFLSDKGNKIMKRVSPSKGVHLVFKKSRFGLNQAMYFDTPDGRMIFAIPEEKVVYVGTTDTFYNDDLENLKIESAEVIYLLNACNSMFPDVNLSEADIASGWVGVRPLIFQKDRSPSEISRRHEIFREKNGLFSIAGGKLTGYRKMAEKMVGLLVKAYFSDKDLKECATKKIKLTGSEFENQVNFDEENKRFINLTLGRGWTAEEANWVFHHFGNQSFEVLELSFENRSNLPEYLHKVLVFTLKNEMVLKVSDFFIRRTNLFYFYPELVKEWKDEVIQLMALYLEENEVWVNQQQNDIDQAFFQIEELKLSEKNVGVVRNYFLHSKFF